MAFNAPECSLIHPKRDPTYNLSCWWMCAKFFWFWWGAVAPFPACMLKVLVSSWWWWTQVSSPVTVLPRNHYLQLQSAIKVPCMCQLHVSTHHAFNSSVTWCRTHLAETLEKCWTSWCADPWLISKQDAISFTITFRFSHSMTSTAAMASGFTAMCAWPGRGESVTELTSFWIFLFYSYICCSDRHVSP